MLEGVDPNAWVKAWKEFVSTSPVAGWSSTVIVGVALAAIIVNKIFVPAIDAIARYRAKK